MKGYVKPTARKGYREGEMACGRGKGRCNACGQQGGMDLDIIWVAGRGGRVEICGICIDTLAEYRRALA